MATRRLSRSCIQLSHSASTFLQLASRTRQAAATLPSQSASQPVLDFLLPTISTSSSSSAQPARSLRRHSYPRRFAAGNSVSSVRAFSSSPLRRATAVVYNARKDDDGNEMHVEITPRASKRLNEIMAKDANPNLALRITVESGGCHGFQYLMSLTTLPPLSTSSESGAAQEEAVSGGKEKAAAIDEDDTVFESLDGSKARVVMDGPSLELLKGSKIDYTMELIGSQFKIVDNPLATSSCGCGTSFDIKI